MRKSKEKEGKYRQRHFFIAKQVKTQDHSSNNTRSLLKQIPVHSPLGISLGMSDGIDEGTELG